MNPTSHRFFGTYCVWSFAYSRGGGGGAVVTKLFSCTAVSKTNMHGVICRGFCKRSRDSKIPYLDPRHEF